MTGFTVMALEDRCLSKTVTVNDRFYCTDFAWLFSVSSDGAVIRRLLDCGADVHTGDLSGDTPIHTAVLHGPTAAIRALYMAGECLFKAA